MLRVCVCMLLVSCNCSFHSQVSSFVRVELETFARFYVMISLSLAISVSFCVFFLVLYVEWD